MWRGELFSPVAIQSPEAPATSTGATGSGVFGGSGLFLTETDGIGAFAVVGTDLVAGQFEVGGGFPGAEFPQSQFVLCVCVSKGKRWRDPLPPSAGDVRKRPYLADGFSVYAGLCSPVFPRQFPHFFALPGASFFWKGMETYPIGPDERENKTRVAPNTP